MTSLSGALRTKMLEQKQLIESWEKKNLEINDIQKPEQRIVEKALSDIQFRGIITRSIGKEFWERVRIGKKDFDRFAILFKLNPGKFRSEMTKRLIPIMKRGYDWESQQSKRLRREYIKKSDHLVELLEQCDINDEYFADGAVIEIIGPTEKYSEYLEFCSAAAIVDKKPRKRREDKSGDAVFFQELFQRGKRSAIFAVFDGLSEKNSGVTDNLSSELAVRLLREHSEGIKNTKSMEDVIELFVRYANEADATISEATEGFGGTTASVGVLIGKQLAYMNIGDSRIYGVSTKGEVKVEKLTTDDGVGAMVERSGSLSLQDFWRESAYPYLYLGSFSQKIQGRYAGRKVLHPSFVLKNPNVGIVDVSNYDMLITTTDGFWRHLPMETKGERVTDATGINFLREMISSNPKGSPLEFAEMLHHYSRENMNLPRLKKTREGTVIPNPGDLGIVVTSV